ncbi:MAG: prepilin-type N-terminal cleavage/methylation domain-containing protein [Legionellaceae bacterium]|nr:prepilin-type N-terminal cleavage/methylation domain-containing protein [Legionellaceae bacterium]
MKNRGFSLTEVLVSLLLVTSISLALLKQQWQISRFSHHLLSCFEKLKDADNQAERHAKGFGLIEIFISLFLVTCIISGLMHHYLQIKRQYHAIQSLTDEAIELQLASDFIRMSVRKAGFTPCQAIHRLDTLDTYSGQTHLSSFKITDHAIFIYRMADRYATASIRSNQKDIVYVSNNVLNQPHPILIADCHHAEVHQVKAVYQTAVGQVIRLQKPLNFAYHEPIYIGPWIEESFFIKRNTHGNLALFYTMYHTEELTELIKELTVRQVQQSYDVLLNITLSLDNQRTDTMDTRVRM